MGFSAVRMAAGAPIAPFFRFPDLASRPSFSHISPKEISRISPVQSITSRFSHSHSIV
jgi:hypothetical protein